MKMLVPIILTKEMNKYVYIIGEPANILFKFFQTRIIRDIKYQKKIRKVRERDVQYDILKLFLYVHGFISSINIGSFAFSTPPPQHGITISLFLVSK